jgi:asparagine synthase (glutamine-hydrolysing)
MCGIVGIFSFDGNPAPFRDCWQNLTNQLHHRGPDEGSWWADGSFFLGHRRLAIIDLSPSGGQPMATPDGSLVITFNGEIYNYMELRDELQEMGVAFQTQSDTEVLLQGYRVWGTGMPARLAGMFAFAIADRRNQTLFLARDRFGEKPLLYTHAREYFAFASELKALDAIPGIPRKLDKEALGGYLCLNYVPGDRTLLTSVRRLPPASWMLLQTDGSLTMDSYWQPPHQVDETTGSISMHEILDNFSEKFDRAVRLALTSDVPVGVFLSGGLDSSLVAEAAVRMGKLSHAYFVDFENQSYSEYEAASEVARKLGLPLERTVLTPKALEDFFLFMEHADDPLADSSGVAVWTVSKLASQKNKVVLGGDGGDEIFGGYLTYQASRMYSQLFTSIPLRFRKWLAKTSTSIPTSEGKVTFSYKLRRFLRAIHLPPEQAHFTWNGTWLPAEAAAFMGNPDDQELILQALPQLTRRLNMNGSDLLHLQLADVMEYLPNDILSKVDRMSMAHGLEVRAPYLDPELAAWGLSLPEKFKINWRTGKTKLLLRAQAKNIFGDFIGDRPKRGFSIPLHSWIRGPLREVVGDLLSPDSIRQLEILDPVLVSKILNQHFSGQASYGFELWGLAILVAWFRARIVRAPLPSPQTPLIERHFPLKAMING